MISELQSVVDAKVKTLRVRRFCIDIAKELTSHKFKLCLQEKCIAHELSAPYSPESNGKTERINRTLMDMARTMLLEMESVPGSKHLWAEAMRTECYLGNRMHSSACVDEGKTPYEVITGKIPDLFQGTKIWR